MIDQRPHVNPGGFQYWFGGMVDQWSLANHSDMHSHTGGCLGMVTSKSMCQKLNTHSSTKVELVMEDDCLPQVLWTCLFLISQGYSTGETIIH